ncbi:TetR/AcrR family transcriptional regulator [Pseudomonas sp. SWRI59]|uniref:TetR/AcrR family transcriptional regulator n=1 Tax=unclassified Pseudomonas TaxID=196821 RepID=UPI0016478A7F|nr:MULTISPECIES: TetR/AcrR family transcriptional regulator [unclassified Pseudomonas]MBC3502591.1 TetR/AcrR family transcriptional regulator [Pseudomonas sp. SWRI59]MBC3508314.1 TetR/AcrR family transcriptional regulator [Pseudomonas sp. SWRI68]
MPDAANTHDCPDFLLTAARELIAEHGYGAMSMRQLAARVGLQPGSLYHHIASKQDLLLDVLLNILAQRLEAWQRGPYTRDLQGYLGFLLARQRSHPCEELLLRHESRHVKASQRVWLAQALDRLQAPLLQAIEHGQRCGQFIVQDIPSAIAAIFALIETADGMRNRPIPVDEAWIEAWITRMSTALLSCPTSADRHEL